MTGRDDKAERYRIMLNIVIRTVRSYGLRTEDTEDLIQVAMVRLFRTMDKWPENPASLAGFTRTTARRTVVDHFRILARRAPYQDRWSFVDTVGEGDEGPEGHVVGVVPSYTPTEIDPDQADAIGAFLERLSEGHRQALMLCAEGYKYEEIAEVTNVSPGTVRSRIHYARKRAQRELKPLLA